MLTRVLNKLHALKSAHVGYCSQRVVAGGDVAVMYHVGIRTGTVEGIDAAIKTIEAMLQDEDARDHDL